MSHPVRFLAIALWVPAAWAQQPPPPAAQADAPGEIDKLKQSCTALGKIGGCAEELFTGVPIHIAVGSIAPQDGFGAGLAYVGHKTTTNWRITWDADAIASNNASWRAGFYMTLVNNKEKPIGISFGTPKVKPNLTELPEHPVIDLYAQTMSLNKLTYFGLGTDTSESGRSFYGMRETIVGTRVVKPLVEKTHLGLYGEVNCRFVDIRPSLGQPSPSLEQLYTEATAPGLTSQPGFVQFAEGVRFRPVLYNDFLRMNYDLAYRQYFAPGDSAFSFQRLTVDLSHQFAIYRKTTRSLLPRDVNGPDECSLDLDHSGCSVDKQATYKACMEEKPPNPDGCKAITSDLQGSVLIRAFMALSMTPGGDTVPFYFMPTIGGSDINGNPALPSYQDYRFRGPDVVLFQQRFEHSILGPVGFAFEVDEGTVALTRGALSSSDWLHSFATGLTLRAGGLPQVYLLFSWGGKEGTHTMANVNTSLLGGSLRPSLY